MRDRDGGGCSGSGRRGSSIAGPGDRHRLVDVEPERNLRLEPPDMHDESMTELRTLVTP